MPNTIQAGVDRRALLQSAAAAGLAATLPGAAASADAAVGPSSGIGELERAFRDPPFEARPAVFWYWMNGVVTREGITADLEAMAAAGFGRAVLFSIGLGPGAPGMRQYPSLTPEWWGMFAFAITEAGRVGMKITVGACDGWATAGGPWITPALSMQRVTFSETWLSGGDRVRAVLPQPLTAMGHYRDIRTIAFPLPAGWSTSVERHATVTTSWLLGDAAAINTHCGGGALDTDREGWIAYGFERPFTLARVIVEGPNGPAGNGLTVEASDDGIAFRAVGTLAQADETTLATSAGVGAKERLAEPTYTLDTGQPVTARAFRFRFVPGPAEAGGGPPHFSGPTGDPVTAPAGPRLRLSRLVLIDEPRVPDLDSRDGRTWSLPLSDLTDADLPPAACVPPASIVDVSAHVAADGALDWSPPDARTWKIVRIGHTSTGAVNGTGFPAGRGLESDKMNPAATRIQFDHWLGELARRVDKHGAGRALATMHTDSWESGSQNWSPVFPAEFARRRGYDLLDHVAIMAGVPVGSADTVNRVLSDVRRTIAEATADNFFGEMERLGRAAGYDYSAETANPIYPVDALIHAKYADRPMGEFWVFGDDKPSDIADAIHGGHVYGRRVIGAEAFTEFAMQWSETPYSCKALGDANWAKGVNQLTCHVWAAQPWVDAAHEPGMTLANIGVFFSRTNTWFGMAKPWFDYLRRGQALLQQGRPVIDLACYIGEEVPRRAYVPSNTPQPIPEGHAFDSINTDALLSRAQVRGGWIMLPEGQRYAALLLPRDWRVSARVLRRIAALVAAGATVIGAPPLGSIGLESGADEVRRLSAMLWPAGAERLHAYGRGRIGIVDDLGAMLRERGVAPDCVIASPRPAAGTLSPFMWTHRAGDGWDLYFVSNQTASAQDVRLRLRVAGRVAELWDADTGTTRPLAHRASRDGTEVSLSLDPCGSAFVIFRGGGGRGGAAAAAEVLGAAVPLTAPWTITFTRGLSAPKTVRAATLASWTTFADEDVRHYAGTAVYETVFPHPAIGSRWRLDLGEVAELCEVEVNGVLLRRLWKPPFHVDLDAAQLRPSNRLVVRVVNTWRNRLVGDAHRAAGERRSFTVTPFFTGQPSPFPQAPPPGSPTVDARGVFLGGGFGNDAPGVPLRGSPAGTPPATLRGASRYGFPGGGATAPGPDVRRTPDGQGLLLSGLIGPVSIRPVT